MTTSDETKKKPLWLLIEENFLGLNLEDISGKNREAAIQKVAGELDTAGYNVSRNGGNMLQLRWAMDDMLTVGRPLLKDFNDAIQKAVFFEMTCRIILTNPKAKPLDAERVKQLQAEGAKA